MRLSDHHNGRAPPRGASASSPCQQSQFRLQPCVQCSKRDLRQHLRILKTVVQAFLALQLLLPIEQVVELPNSVTAATADYD